MDKTKQFIKDYSIFPNKKSMLILKDSKIKRIEAQEHR